MDTSEILDTLHRFKQERGKVYGILALGLFGSSARGEQKEDSDIDVCVELEHPSFFTRMNIRNELEDLFRRKVDVISLKAIMRPLFRQSLERDVLYV